MKQKPFSHPVKVVVVNDDPFQLSLLSGLLRKAEFIPMAFSSAEQALEAMQTSVLPDLIITDLFMPKIDGWRFCRLLRSPEYAAFNAVPVLVVSATYSGDMASSITTDLGADAFLSAPVDAKRFIGVVHALLRGEISHARPGMLIAEEDHQLACAMHDAFVANDFCVEVAATLHEWEEKLERGPYEIAVLSHNLSDSEGSIITRFCEMHPACACIITTSDSEPDLALRWMRMGASATVRKPFPVEYIIELAAKARREKSLLRVEELLESRTCQLRESEERLRQALYGADLGTWDWHVPSGAVAFNERWAQMVGYTLDEIKPSLDSWSDLVHPDDMPGVMELLNAHLEGETDAYSAEFRMRHKQGYWVWILDKGRVITRDANGKPIRACGTHLDISEQKRTEAALAWREQYLKTILQTTADGFWVLDANGKVIDVNETYCRMLGYPREEFLGLSIAGIDAVETPAETKARVQRIIKNGSEVFETRHRRKDGSIFDVEVSSTYLNYNGGQFVCFCRDITARKHAERSLRQAQSRLQALWDVASLSDASTKMVSDHILRAIAEMTESQYGFYGFINEDETVMTIHSWTGDAMQDCAMVDKPQHFPVGKAGIWAEAIRRREPLIINNYKTAHEGKKGIPEGHVQLTNLLVVPHFTRGKITTVAAVANRAAEYTQEDVAQLTTFLNSIQALTDSKRAEEALRESEALHRSLIEVVPAPVYCKDAELRYTRVNQAFCKFFNRTEQEMMGKTIFDILPYDIAAINSEKDQELIVNPGVQIYESHAKDAQGATHNVIYHKATLIGADSTVQGIVGVILDITEMKRAQEKMRQQAHMLDVAPASITVHDYQGRFLYANKKTYELHENNEAEFMRINIHNLDVPESEQLFDERVLSLSQTGEARFEVGHYRKDGSTFPLEVFSQTVEWEGIPAILSIATDISQRKQAEQALAESRARILESNQILAGILEHTHIMAVYLDAQFNFIWVNRAYAETCGHPPSFFVGKNHFALYPHAENQAIFQGVVDSGLPIYAEAKPFTFPDQPERGVTYWDWSLIPVKTDEDKIAGLVFTLVDVTQRIRQENELQLKSMVLDQITDQVTITDLDGNINYVNQAQVDKLGMARQALLGNSTRIFGEDANRGATQQEILEKTVQNGFWRGEVVNYGGDGREHIMDCRTQIVRNLQGRAIALCGISTDITERKRVENELNIHAQNLKSLFNAIHESVFMIDTNGILIMANDTFMQRFNTTLESCLGKPVYNMITPDVAKHRKAMVDNVLKTRQGIEFEDERQGIWIHHSICPVYDDDGNVARLAVYAMDITERRNAEMALRESEERFRQIVERSNDVFYRQDINTEKCEYMSPKVEEMLGYSPEECMAMDLSEQMTLFHPEDVPLLENFKEELIKADSNGARYIEREFRMVTKQKQVKWIHGNYSLLRDKKGAPFLIVGGLADITKRKIAEELLQRQYELSIDLSNTTDIIESLKLCLQAALDISGMDCGGAYLTDEESGALRLAWQCNLSERFIQKVSYYNPDTMNAKIVQKGVPIYINYQDFLEKGRENIDGLRAMALLPVIYEGKSIACLNIASHTLEEVPKSIRPMMETIAAQVGGFLARVILHAKLKESEEIHRALVENIPDLVIRYDSNLRHLYVSNNIEDITGKDPAMFLGKSHREMGYPENMCRLWDEAIAQVFQQGAPVETEYEYTSKKGNSIYNWRLVPEYTPAGKMRTVLSIARDVTAHRKAEQALQESLKTSNDIVQAIPSGLFIYKYQEPDTLTLIAANPAAEKLTGIRIEEWRGHSFDELWPEARNIGLYEKYINVIRTGMNYEDESLQYKDNRLTGVYRIHAFALPQKCLAVAFEDITERKIAEEALQASEERYRELVENANSIIIRLDKEGRITFFNEYAQRFYGYKYDEVIGRQAIGTIVPETESTGRNLKELLYDIVHYPEQYAVNENENILRDGKRVWVSWTNKSLYDDAGNLREILCVGNDATLRKSAENEREKLQAQLLQAQKMESVGRLAGGVAHDFNNMLGVILGHAEMALEQTPAGMALHYDLQEIRKAAERSANLTRQLLAFARKQTVTPKILDLNETIEGMLKMLGRLIGENIELIWKPEKSLWKIKMDPAQVDQILANLCVNARDAINGNGRITIETKMTTLNEEYCAIHPGSIPGEYVILIIQDTGCGIEKETMKHIFEPFFTTKGLGEGTGLGLATVYGIVKQNEGIIHVNSEPGSYTTFIIYLPRYKGKENNYSNEIEQETIIRGTETVLLVEDEPALLKMTAIIIESLGYRVLPASTPMEAIRHAETYPGRIDLLLTDVIMPEMNGRELTKRIQQYYPMIKRVFMSGYTADIIAHHGVLEEGIQFLQKPFTRESLASIMRKTLDAPNN